MMSIAEFEDFVVLRFNAAINYTIFLKKILIPLDKTPITTTDGHQRPVDDFQLRAQIKKHMEEGTLTDSESIT